MTNSENTSANTAGEQGSDVSMKILTQFVRDLSFENVLSRKRPPAGEITPEVQISINLDAQKRQQENQYELSQKLQINSKNEGDGEAIFAVELDYVGVFHIEGVEQSRLHAFLFIECARFMFPFIRQIVSDITRDGGMPPLNLDVVDYLALYKANIERQKQQDRMIN